MKLRHLLLCFAIAAAPAHAATVLTNATGTPSTSQLVKGPGGFIPQPISLGFEFTVSHPDDWALLSVSLNVASNTGASPLLVELYGSPSGPDTATLISALSGNATPTPGTHTWSAVTPITLNSGDTYFVKISVPSGAGSYGFARTAEPLTGDWTLNAHYTQAGSAPWSASAGNAPMLTITAVPEPSVLAALAGCVGVLLLVRRRTGGVHLGLVAALVTATQLATPASAEIVNFNLETAVVPTNYATSTLALPYDEEGLRLQGNVNSVFIGGTISAFYTGVAAMTPPTLSSGQNVTLGISNPAGRLFSVRSVTLHPRNAAVNVTFTGWKNGNGQLQTHSTGTALSGTTVTFNSNFERVNSFTWTMPRVGGNYQFFQISSIVVEFDGVLSTPLLSTFNEAGGTASIPVRLAHPRSVDTPLTYQITTTTSASPPGDFTLPGGSATGSITIPAGQTEARLEVPLVNDTGIEPLEKFQVVFTSTTPGATFANGFSDAIAEVQIASDDGIANFAGWMTAHGLTGNAALPNADPNGDGVSNIESWLHRINPAGPSPQAWLDRRATFFTTAANVPGLRLTVPTPLPADVRMIFEETTTLSPWSEQTRRSGFATGSLWTGTGASRVVESNTLTARTITFPGSASRSARARAFYRMKYELVSGGSE